MAYALLRRHCIYIYSHAYGQSLRVERIDCNELKVCEGQLFSKCKFKSYGKCNRQCHWDYSSQKCRYGDGETKTCQDIDIKDECDEDNNNCEWVNSQCRAPTPAPTPNPPTPNPTPPTFTRCSDYDTDFKCRSMGCSWDNSLSTCRSYSLWCSDYDDEEYMCKNKGCYWENTTRRCNPVCSKMDSNTCEKSGLCSWKRSGPNRPWYIGTCEIVACNILNGHSLSECQANEDCWWDSNSNKCNFRY